MSQRYVLGVDAGQTAIKAVLHDEELRPISVARRASPLDTSTPRHAERSHDELWAAAADAIGDAISRAGIDPAAIVAVAITGHGDGLHLVDAAGDAVGPAITAVDSRAFGEVDELLADADRTRTVLELSGQVPTAGSPGPLLKWVANNRPKELERASAMLSCKDVIRLRLTGRVSTDLSDASASFLDTRRAHWSSEILDAYGLGGLDRLLPELQCGGDAAGSVRHEAAERTGLAEGTPVIAGVHDVQAAAIGLGALIPDRLALVAGSFSTNGVTTTRDDVDPRWQSRLSIRPDLRIAMSTSPTASPALEWLLGLLGITDVAQRDRLFAEAAALDPQEKVPFVLPFFYASPLGADASAVLAGVRGWHSRAHILRGMLEGIALMHVWHTQALAERFEWDETVVLGGGISNSPLYVRLVANALRAPIRVIHNEEPGAFGAAALAAVSQGLFPTIEAAQEKVVGSPVVEPTDESAAYWEEARASLGTLGSALEPWWSAHRSGTQEKEVRR
ncbi:MAG: L-xylulokinase [Microbacteriaceae bacterium]|nr:L-xylulokinase [Microbacteriaceae bacterium]